LKAEIGEESYDFSSLLTLGQLSEDQESPPTSAFTQPDTFESNAQRIHKRFGDTTALHDSSGPNMLVSEVDEGQNDADGEDPFGNLEGDGLGEFDRARPSVEG